MSTTITGLPDATTPLTGAERVPMDQSGTTKDATTQDIANLAGSAITAAIAVHDNEADPHNGASPTFDNLTLTGLLTAPHVHGSVAGDFYVHVKNTSGGTLAANTAVYATGSVGDTDRIEVAACDPTDPAKMPAIGLLTTQLGNNAEGDAIILGELRPTNTSSYVLGDELYVGAGGALVNTIPVSGTVQHVGSVARVQADTGTIVVGIGAGLSRVGFTGAYADLSGAPAGLADGDKGDITVSGSGTVWSIDAGVVSTTKLGGDITTAGKALLDDADAAAQRTTLGLAAVAASGAYSDLSGTPTVPAAADAAPQPLGVAAIGASTDYAREDHVHAMPSAADVGADPSGTASSAISTHEAAADPHPGYALESSLGTAATLNVGTAAGNVVQLDGSGALPAVDGSNLTGITAGGTPGGTTGQVQFNDAGSFGGDSGLLYDATSGSLTVGGKTVTTDAPVINLSQTWNNAATAFTGLKLNVTNTASAAASNLLDLQVGGVSRFQITNESVITGSYFIAGSNAALGVEYFQAPNLYTGNRVSVGIAGVIGWTSGTPNLANDLTLYRDAANTFAQRNGTNAQTFRLYNTYTDASNYERGFLQWNSNVLEIGSEGAGTGSEQPVRITAATLKLPNLPTYADNAAATTGGLVAGDVYKTATGELRITV